MGCRAYFLLVLGFSSPGLCAQWETVGEGWGGLVRDLHYDSLSGRLYVVGASQWAMPGNVLIHNTAYWYNGQWYPMGGGADHPNGFPTGLRPPAKDIIPYDSGFVVVGDFWSMSGVPHTRGFAKWENDQWVAMASDTTLGNFWGSSVDDGQLHLHGAFNTVDGQPISNWAVYDGTTWQQVDTTEEFGFNTAKAVRYQGDLYVAGNFNTSNGVNDLARQGPNGWEALGPGLLGDPWVNEMVVYDGLLWVTGEFYSWWGNAASGIMAWDGSQWHNMFPDIFAIAQGGDLDVANGKLYFSGFFNANGMNGMYGYGVYDGSSVCLFGGPEVIRGNMTFSADTMYASAPYTLYGTAGGPVVKYIIKWPLDAPMDTCYTVASRVPALGAGSETWTVSPNPATGHLTVQAGGAWQQLRAYDATGRLVLAQDLPQPRIAVGHLPAGLYTLIFLDAKGYPVGRARFAKE